jgi:hypothetical protein
MEKLVIKKTNNSPSILMDPVKGLIEFKGSSFLEDSVSFYIPVMDWIDEYVANPMDTTINCELTYFNSSAAKILITAFKSFKIIKKSNQKLIINWSYTDDDEDIRDSGLDFSKLTGLDFNMIEKV